MNALGRRLFKWRNAAGLSRRQVAEETGIPYQSLSNIENNTTSMSRFMLNRLADLYRVDADLELYLLSLKRIELVNIILAFVDSGADLDAVVSNRNARPRLMGIFPRDKRS